jgi:membrane protein
LGAQRTKTLLALALSRRNRRILFWLLASLGLRLYLHFFNVYSFTYGSLGAVIILLMWFYITGFMILLGAEINSEIEAAAEIRLSTFPANPATNPANPSKSSS